MRARFLYLAGLIATLAGTLTANGPAPDIVNAKLDQASAAAGLAAAFAHATRSETAPSWMGYTVPAVADAHPNGRGNSGWNSCSAELEEGVDYTNGSSTAAQLAKRSVMIFLRIGRQQIEKVRMFEAGCRVDAGGMPVHWLTDVRPAESVQLLRGYVESNATDAERPSRSMAVAAIASTDDPSADAAMQKFISPSSSTGLAKQAVFWLGAARGRRGYEILRTIVKTDPRDEVRERAIFALSISPAPEAVDTLIDVARTDNDPRRREKALFWLAHKAGERAASVVTSAVENDPDTEVKKKAVFALTQLPADQGIPTLIKVARTNSNPQVRKQAFFWLGQSHDPRALDFIAHVLAE